MSVILESGLETKAITMEVRDQPISEVLNFVARRFGVNVRHQGKLYYIGALEADDRGVLVRRVRRLTKEQLAEVLQVFSGQNGRATQFADGLVVVGDSVEVLGRINEMIDQVEAAETSVWVVQLHLLSYSRSAADELGINVEPAAKAGLAFASGSALGGAKASWELATSLDAVLQVAYSRDDVAVTAAPMFIVSDGEKASFVQGDRVPIPRRTVSPEGTVTTAGFDYVQTGVNVELTLRETEPRGARVDVVINMSDVKRFRGGSAGHWRRAIRDRRGHQGRRRLPPGNSGEGSQPWSSSAGLADAGVYDVGSPGRPSLGTSLPDRRGRRNIGRIIK